MDGREDLRALLSQSAQNALNTSSHPLYKWGWKLVMRKSHKNIAVSAIARKIAVSIWYLLSGRFTPLIEVTKSLKDKMTKLATAIGSKQIKEMGFTSNRKFEEHYIGLIQQCT